MSVMGQPSPTYSARRFACDRCRGQKLRCPREGTNGQNNEPCRRCDRAGVKCLTSPSGRIGRPVRSTALEARERKRRNTLAIRASTRSEKDCNMGGANTTDSSALTQSTSSQVGSALSLNPWPELQPWVQNPNVMGFASLPAGIHTLPNSDDDLNRPISSWPNSDKAKLFGIGFRDSNGALGQLRSSADFIVPDVLHSAIPKLPQDTTLAGQARCAASGSGGSGGIDQNAYAYVLTSCAGFLDAWGESECPSYRAQNSPEKGVEMSEFSERKCTEDFTQQLLTLNLSLIRQTRRMASDAWTTTLLKLATNVTGDYDNSASCDDLGISDILNTSQDFLEILDGFLPSCDADSMASSDTDSNYSGSPKNRYYDIEESPIQATTGTYINPNFVTGNLNRSVVSLSFSQPTEPVSTGGIASIALCRPDIPTVLLMVTCYVHIIHLYDLLFMGIYRSLLTIPATWAPPLLYMPRLQPSGPSTHNGNLQIPILIQAATHLLDRIERVLGLPQESRLYGSEGQYRGLLSDGDVGEMVKTMLQLEEIESGRNGRGGLKTLRESIKKITQLLRSSIAL
ncbi:hypothetical protein AOQ84DRAFT_408842 [Glonium stellatum]|uniref:Zn(2)-C6 fungal-type domain-containing protein n=1 Tax=Glonium stellatum TaxID=574774 RepID=A0A8E2JS09_9PEZI|nr:hypothetical protein AOQ84DRAFT_408842 [Glonium stellatum]